MNTHIESDYECKTRDKLTKSISAPYRIQQRENNTHKLSMLTENFVASVRVCVCV